MGLRNLYPRAPEAVVRPRKGRANFTHSGRKGFGTPFFFGSCCCILQHLFVRRIALCLQM